MRGCSIHKERSHSIVGRLIPTGAPNLGHSIDFEYVGTGRAQKCFMDCQCGFRVEIEFFRHSWSVIEINVRFRKHMLEVGLQPNE
jgi:hypothetical protein